MKRKKPKLERKRPEQCLNCGMELTHQFCPVCGQNNRDDRLHVSEITGAVFHELLELELPLVRSIIGLTIRPGRVCREFIEGQRRKYSNPLRYCLIMAFIFTLVGIFVEIDPNRLFPAAVQGDSAAKTELMQAYVRELQQFMFQNYNWIILLTIPIFAFLLKLMFFRSGRNYAEHLAFVMFIIGHRLLLESCFTLLGWADHPQLHFVIEAVILIYFIWAAMSFYFGRPVWRFIKVLFGGIILRLTVVLVGGIVATVFFVIPDVRSGRLQEMVDDAKQREAIESNDRGDQPESTPKPETVSPEPEPPDEQPS